MEQSKSMEHHTKERWINRIGLAAKELFSIRMATFIAARGSTTSTMVSAACVITMAKFYMESGAMASAIEK